MIFSIKKTELRPPQPLLLLIFSGNLIRSVPLNLQRSSCTVNTNAIVKLRKMQVMFAISRK